MHIDSNLIPLFAIAVGLIIGVTRILSSTFTSYRLKVEQIRADAMVRAEEVRSRNQLELEKLMRQDQAGAANQADTTNQQRAAYQPGSAYQPVENYGRMEAESKPSQYGETDRNPRNRVRE